MPINIPDKLPAADILAAENIFVMTENRALHQDIRPLEIAILNLMPTKIETETQLLRLLGNTPLQVDIVLLHPESHQSQNTSQEHLANFYQTFSQIKSQKFDGLIITGAPVEKLDFEEVDYWDELQQIMAWSKESVFSTLHICWGAQAGLYYHYGIPKVEMDKKISGIYRHTVNIKENVLVRGFDDMFYAPHSRYTGLYEDAIRDNKKLEIVADSPEAGSYLIIGRGGRQVFVTGHSEYNSDTLKKEYLRDVKKGLEINIPENYFPDNNPVLEPVVNWRSHAFLLFSNWLNYFVYQATPYDINSISQ